MKQVKHRILAATALMLSVALSFAIARQARIIITAIQTTGSFSL